MALSAGALADPEQVARLSIALEHVKAPLSIRLDRRRRAIPAATGRHCCEFRVGRGWAQASSLSD